VLKINYLNELTKFSLRNKIKHLKFFIVKFSKIEILNLISFATL
jgi:hypothetical protein